MKNISAKGMLLVAGAVVVLILVVTSPLTTIWLVSHQTNRVLRDPLRGLATSSLASVNVSEGFIQVSLAVNSTSTAEQQEHLAELARSTQVVDAHYQALQTTLGTDEERADFAELLSRRHLYRQTRTNVLMMLERGDRFAAKACFDKECTRRFQAYTATLGQILEHNAAEAAKGGDRVIRLSFVFFTLQILLLGFLFLYGLFVPSVALVERLVRKPSACEP